MVLFGLLPRCTVLYDMLVFDCFIFAVCRGYQHVAAAVSSCLFENPEKETVLQGIPMVFFTLCCPVDSCRVISKVKPPEDDSVIF
uniref:Putative secreted protein n=1 Tax=Anopheles darlingi TaxID=43151 RepID=A0A2M4DBR8_ANODA